MAAAASRTLASKTQENLKWVVSHPEGASMTLSEAIDLLAEVSNIEGLTVHMQGSGNVYVIRLVASPLSYLREIGRI